MVNAQLTSIVRLLPSWYGTTQISCCTSDFHLPLAWGDVLSKIIICWTLWSLVGKFNFKQKWAIGHHHNYWYIIVFAINLNQNFVLNLVLYLMSYVVAIRKCKHNSTIHSIFSWNIHAGSTKGFCWEGTVYTGYGL